MRVAVIGAGGWGTALALLLTRALSREKEIAVRVAMGASPRQLIVQLLAESAVLSIAGAAVGALAARLTLPTLVSLMPVSIPRLEDAAVDGRALGLGLAVIVATTIFFGLVPALVLLRSQIVNDLRTGERGSSRGARAIYSLLVVGEVALACALLVSSGLLVRTVGRMIDTPTGIDANDVVVSSVQLSGRAGGGSPSTPIGPRQPTSNGMKLLPPAATTPGCRRMLSMIAPCTRPVLRQSA